MIITATTDQQFEVSPEWMKACGLAKYSNVFDVDHIEDLAPGLVMVIVKSPIIGHGGEWVVNQNRGTFI